MTPDAPRSILNSNTNKEMALRALTSRRFQVLQLLAEDMKLPVERRPIDFEAEVDSFAEVGAVGTAVVVTPIRSLTRGDRTWRFGEPKAVLKRELREPAGAARAARQAKSMEKW